MEMNTRLQALKHPGDRDDYATRFSRMAIKKLLGWRKHYYRRTKKQLKIHGHAFEARIYAEDPEHTYPLDWQNRKKSHHNLKNLLQYAFGYRRNNK